MKSGRQSTMIVRAARSGISQEVYHKLWKIFIPHIPTMWTTKLPPTLFKCSKYSRTYSRCVCICFGRCKSWGGIFTACTVVSRTRYGCCHELHHFPNIPTRVVQTTTAKHKQTLYASFFSSGCTHFQIECKSLTEIEIFLCIADILTVIRSK